MEYQTLILPVDGLHILRKAFAGWEYIVQETETFKKAYTLYDNEVDAQTYNFDGYRSKFPDMKGGIIVTFHADDDRHSRTYDMHNKIIREDTLSMTQIFENLKRHALPKYEKILKVKKESAVPYARLQSVELPVDNDHTILQTSLGLWRYSSKLSNRVYVLYLSEIYVLEKSVIITLYDRSVKYYVDGKSDIKPAKDILVYLMSKEKEQFFDDMVTCNINKSMIVNRRGWGRYIHFLDDDFAIHAFLLDESDESPAGIPHVLDMHNIGETMTQVVLHKEVYEDHLVNISTGEYTPLGTYRTALELSKQTSKSGFRNQKGKLQGYASKDSRVTIRR